MEFVAIDFETANEKRSSACSLGIAVVEQGQIKTSWHSLIRPTELRVAAWNHKVHKISESQLQDAPKLVELWPEVEAMLHGRLVVAHNAAFDFSVLRHSLNASNLLTPELQYLCTLQLARSFWPTFVSHNLGFLAKHFGIGLEHHNAEQDARACAELLLLASRECGVNCPFEIARKLQVSIGLVLSNEEWVPSREVGVRLGRREFELDLPEGYDISKHELYGKRIVFTGTLALCSRDDAKQTVETLGGIPGETVNKATDYIVTGYQDLRMMASGQSESSKLRKAKQLREQGCKIQILTDQDFQEMLFSSTQLRNQTT